MEPEKRNIALSFQENCLFPHYNVIDNIKFGADRNKNATRCVQYLKKTKLYKHNEKELSLKEMQALVGGYIQVLESKDGKADIIFDEEGKFKDKPVNIEATKLWLGEDIANWYDVIVGDAIVCTNKARLK